MKKNIITKLIVFMCLITLNTNAQDIITKNDGTEIKAKVLEINTTEVKFKRFDYIDGPTVVLPVSELNYIKYPNGSIETFKKNNTENNKTPLQSSAPKSYRDTILKSYYPTGQLLCETPYKMGEINGIQKIYYKTGQITSETPFVNGLANGTSMSYYKSGRWMHEIPYVDGKINGIVKYQPERSMLIRILKEVKFVDNKGYYPSGELYEEIPLGNGIINGEVKFYDKKGWLLSVYPYINNAANGRVSVYRENGTESWYGFYVDGLNTTKEDIAGAVIQGLQGGVAYYNYQTNRNSQTTSDYVNIAMNNATKSTEDAIKDNNKILESSSKASSSSNSTAKSESSAITSSGKDGNSPEGIACSKEAKSQWEASKEYHDFYDNRNNINSPQLRNGELCKAKYADILLQHCKQYLSEAEKNALTTTRDNCIKNANEMNGNTINPK